MREVQSHSPPRRLAGDLRERPPQAAPGLSRDLKHDLKEDLKPDLKLDLKPDPGQGKGFT
jgi:hypothetical protein